MNFARAVPADGFAPTVVTITNNGDKPVDLTLTDFPFDYLCLKGFTEAPAELPSLDTEEQALLTVSVCDYDAEGGRGVERAGEIRIDANGNEETLRWSFLPIVDQDDTGL